MSERWELSKKFLFEASHQLKNHDGKCSRLHGHSWVGWISISRGQLFQSGPKKGMVFDYADLSAIVKPIVEESLDHWHLNDTVDEENPTSEIIAKWMWIKVETELRPLLREDVDDVIDSLTVTIEETCTSRCVYSVSRGS